VSATILVVEDEPVLREALAYNLARQGYEVVEAADGRVALELARSRRPDLVLLDIMLPGMDGFEVCRVLRREKSLPILMLTARDDEVDKIVGLELGADDYMTKPFSMRELLARVKALLRRERAIREELAAASRDDDQPAPGRQLLTFDDLIVNLERQEVTLAGEVLHLKPREYDLLVFLARNRGIALSRDLILERVWGWERDPSSRTVDVHIRWLRAKIEPDPAVPRRIVTIRNLGYRFEG
jgi:DNA-binding response OmpR family regulator